MFNNIFLSILILFTIGFSQTTSRWEDSSLESGQAEVKKVGSMQRYAPTFYLLKTMNNNVEKGDYETIKKAVREVENSLPQINRLMDSLREEIDYQKSLYHHRYDFASSENYHEVMVRAFGDNHLLIRTKKKLESALEKFNSIKGSLGIQVEESQIRELEYKLNKFSGVLLIFLGKGDSLRKAVIHFENILPHYQREALTDDKRELIEIYNYLAGIFHTLYLKNTGSSYRSTYYLKKELECLWNLVDLETRDDIQLKEHKYRHLVEIYYDVIDVENPFYQPYFDQIQEKKKSATLKRVGYVK